MSSKLQKFFALSVVSMAAVAGNAQAATSPYSDLVIFGDSISDTGNVLSLTPLVGQPAFPTFPGAAGRFSNGPVWTEYLASGLGLPNGAVNSNRFLYPVTNTVINIGIPGGTNYAFGGARTGMSGSAGPNTGLFAELTAWNGSTFSGALNRAADPNALYVLMAGANDLRDLRDNLAAPASQLTSGAAQTAQNVVFAMNLLAQAGANHFLISSLPDLGKTPEVSMLNAAYGTTAFTAASTTVTLAFNSALANQAAGLDALYNNVYGRDLDIKTLDFYGLVENIYTDATTNNGQTYGITNVKLPCITPGAVSHQYFFGDATGSGCDVSAFSDPLHPSSRAHQLLAAEALSTLGVAPVPEPSSIAMLVAGLMVIGGVVRRRTAAR